MATKENKLIQLFYPNVQWKLGQEDCLDRAERCVKIADEFAIGLLEFIEGTYSYSNIFDYWYLHGDTSKTYTKKQLLEIYKKEKGL